MMVKPKKHLGQHFLRDLNIARKISSSLDELSTVTNVLEVGPGTGVLTQYLLERYGDNFYAIEVDIESVDFLRVAYPQLGKRLIYNDFLKLNISDIFQEPFRLIGNLPYNISSQIFFKVIDHKDLIPEVVCMIQKEVAERLASKPNSKQYGILSVFLQAFYEVKYLFTVNEQVFDPPPKVKSAVIRLTRNQTLKLDCNEILFRKVVKSAFNQRRKTIRNSLKSAGFSTLPETEYLSMRPEQLGVNDFVELVRLIEPLIACE